MTGGRHFGVISGWISGLISEPTLAFSTGNDEFFFGIKETQAVFYPLFLWPFSIAMLVYQRVDHINIPLNHYKIPLNHHKSHCITIYQRVDPFFFPPFCHSRPG